MSQTNSAPTFTQKASTAVWGWMTSLGESLGQVVSYIVSDEGLGENTGELDYGDKPLPMKIQFRSFPSSDFKGSVRKIIARTTLISPVFAEGVPALDLNISYETPAELAEKVQPHQVRDEVRLWLAPLIAECEQIMLGFYENQVNSAEDFNRESPQALQEFLDTLPAKAAILTEFAGDLKQQIETEALGEIERIYRKYAENVDESCAQNFKLSVTIVSNTMGVVSGVGGLLVSGFTGGVSGVMGVTGILNSLAALNNAYLDCRKTIEAIKQELETDLVSLGQSVGSDRQGFKETMFKLVDGAVGDIRKLVENGARVPDGTYKLFGMEVQNALGSMYQSINSTTDTASDRLAMLKARTGELQKRSNLALNALDQMLESKQDMDKDAFETLFGQISGLNVDIKTLVDVIDHANQRLEGFKLALESWNGAKSFAEAAGVAFNFGVGLFDFENTKFKMPEGTLEWMGAIGGLPALFAVPWGDAYRFGKAALGSFVEELEASSG